MDAAEALARASSNRFKLDRLDGCGLDGRVPLSLSLLCARLDLIVVLAALGWFGLTQVPTQAQVRGLSGGGAEWGWPQFRGLGGRGVSERPHLPVVLGPRTNVFSDAAVPSGNSSPIVKKGKVLLKGYAAATGKGLYLDEKLGMVGDDHASPVGCGDFIYRLAQSGVAMGVRVADSFEVGSRNELGAVVMGAAAAAQGTLFIRTGSRLYAFRNKEL